MNNEQEKEITRIADLKLKKGNEMLEKAKFEKTKHKEELMGKLEIYKFQN
jgi:hypothetical protein